MTRPGSTVTGVVPDASSAEECCCRTPLQGRGNEVSLDFLDESACAKVAGDCVPNKLCDL